jgi:hypothetical protein
MKAKVVINGLLFVALILPLALCGCSPSGKFGDPIKNTEETSIPDVLYDPESFVGKTVMMKGQVATVDDDGGGFQLDNGLGRVIYVKVAGDFKISGGAKYHLAAAEGKVEIDKNTGEPRLLASAVEIK